MSAKPSRKAAAKSARMPEPAPAGPAPARSIATPPAAEVAAVPAPSWLESTDPRKRRWGQIVLVGVWIYVAALWLLALDRTFDWGVFGPTTPPLP